MKGLVTHSREVSSNKPQNSQPWSFSGGHVPRLWGRNGRLAYQKWRWLQDSRNIQPFKRNNFEKHQQSHINKIKCSKDKCKILHLDSKNLLHHEEELDSGLCGGKKSIFVNCMVWGRCGPSEGQGEYFCEWLLPTPTGTPPIHPQVQNPSRPPLLLPLQWHNCWEDATQEVGTPPAFPYFTPLIGSQSRFT